MRRQAAFASSGMRALAQRRAFGAGLLTAASASAAAGAAAAVRAGAAGRTAAAAAGLRSAAVGSAPPLLRFGAIADVQYADVEDAWNFAGTQRRRYRAVLESLSLAVQDWAEGPPLSFIADLGDIIDQQCESMGNSHEALQRVLDLWRPADDIAPVLHLIGNHELYNFNREECARLIPHIKPWYQSFRPVPGWRVIVLDSFDLNVIEHGGGEAVEEGMAYLSQHNPNDLRAPRGTIDLGSGLKGLKRRFMPMGGALRQAQLRWLEQELREVAEEDEQAIVLTHVPIHPEATVPGGLLWNYDEVLEAFRRAGDGRVALVLAGHYHEGAYTLDRSSGTHHVTLPSPLHADEGEPRAHCNVEVFEDRVEIRGRGLVPSRTLSLRRSERAAHSVPKTSQPVIASSL